MMDDTQERPLEHWQMWNSGLTWLQLAVWLSFDVILTMLQLAA
jgi:hypothetical protein